MYYQNCARSSRKYSKLYIAVFNFSLTCELDVWYPAGMKADEIKNLRLKLGYSQQEFASLLSVSFATVNRWENGKAKPQKDRVDRLRALVDEKASLDQTAAYPDETPFLIPRLDFEGDPEAAEASPKDVRYLLDGVEPFLPDGPWSQIHYTTAGVRALVRVEGVPASSVGRGHQVVDHERQDGLPGLISVVGGKITAYRSIAEEVVDLASGRLGMSVTSSTDREALPGGQFAGRSECISETVTLGRRLGLEEDQSRYLVDTYGIRAQEVLAIVERAPRLSERICLGAPDILAQVNFAVEKEMALTVEDFMLRRSLLGHTASRGVEGVDKVAVEMGAVLDWTEARRQAEIDGYLERIKKTSVAGLAGRV